MSKDYYKILGVPRDAADDEIKKSYRKLAKKYHPDVCSEDDASHKFKEISEAYQVLGDPQKRRDYDMFGSVDAGPGFGDFGVFDDLFGMFFNDFSGTAHSRSVAERGADLGLNIEVEFKEAVFGTEKSLKVDKPIECSACKGAGAKAGTSASTCPDCGGSGQKRTTQRTLLGNFIRSYPCERCRGVGRIITSPCSECNGQGRKPGSETVSIEIPAGIVGGMRLRLNGKGQAGLRGGPAGDLYVTVLVKPHELFQRDGDDIYCKIPLTFSQATLGAEIEIPTLNGSHELEIPSGTQTETVFRLRNMGVPHLGGRGRGDQVVQVTVEVPKKLTKRQKELLKELAEVSGEDLNSLSPGFLRKFKKIL